ncbi:MAG TPA: TadE/TadG family type IV pilus assembly protein [Stellaceae bacterium]|jgi:Flp pilus assembly protein TadG|nr:TadE/TadG family type IV pilus assembly protein [Stellaceae bacterium]
MSVKTTRPPRDLWAACEGVSIVEFALVVGLLCTLVLGVLDFGRGYWQFNQVRTAAQAGAQYAMINGFNSTSITSAVTGATSVSSLTATPAPAQTCGCPNTSSGITAATCGAACTGGGTADTYITIGAQASYRTIFTWPGISNPMTLSSTAIVRCC